MKSKFLVLMFGIVFLFSSVSAFDTYINNSNIFVDGRVGIGTNSPITDLQIGSSFGNHTITFGDENWQVRTVQDSSLYNMEFSTYDSDNRGFKFTNNNNDDLVYIEGDTGYVGVGTTSPSNSLHIYGTSGNIAQTIQSTEDNAIINIIADSSNLASDVNQDAILYFLSGQAISGDAEVRYDGSLEAIKLNAQTNDGNQLVIASDGSVGVGTSSPDNILHVVGNATIEGNTKVLNGDLVVNKDLTVGYENLTHGKLRFDDSSGKMQFSNDNGSNWIDFTELNKAGVSWTPRSTPFDSEWFSIAYGNGLFVAVAYSGSGDRVMTSPDGVTWTSRSVPVNNSWGSIAYGNGLFVATSFSGTGNRVMTSPDGITWTVRSTPADYSWRAVTYGNGTFVAVASSGTGNRVMTSTDGVTWTLRSTPADNNWYSVTYGDGLFVATSISGSSNRVMTSPDGVTWTVRSTPVDNDWRSVAYGNGLFVAVANSGFGNRIMTSADGISWTVRSNPVNNDWRAVAYGGGLFVAVSTSGSGDRVMTSSDGITWTSRSTPVDNSWRSIAYGNGLFVGVSNDGSGNRVMTSGIFISGGVETTSSVWDKDGNDVSYVSGNVGIGRDPSINDLEVEGTASKSSAGDWLANSDLRIKTDVKNISGALGVIDMLRPVKFRYTDDYRERHFIEDKVYYNFIAQEYGEVFPESVKGSGEFLEDGAEILQMDSYNAQVVAIAAIQELREENEELRSENLQIKRIFCEEFGRMCE